MKKSILKTGTLNVQSLLNDYNELIQLNFEEAIPLGSYIVLLTQAGTAAPTVEVLSDTITGIVWARTGVGTYTATKAGAFTLGKTTPNTTGAHGVDIAGNKLTAEQTSVNVITVKTYAAVDTTVLADDVLSGHEFQIKIYS